jgi:hypothetical protein
MATPKTMSGARAKVSAIVNGVAKILGTFSQISYGVTYETQPVWLLGRYTAAENVYTSVDIVQINASGWRSVGHGWHTAGLLPRVQDLMFAGTIELQITDRQSEIAGGEPRIARITEVLPTSGSGGFEARQLAGMTHTFVGLLVSDESVTNAESPNAVQLP